MIVAPFVEGDVTPTIAMRSAIGSPLGAFGGSCASVLLEASRPSNFIRPGATDRRRGPNLETPVIPALTAPPEWIKPGCFTLGELIKNRPVQ